MSGTRNRQGIEQRGLFNVENSCGDLSSNVVNHGPRVILRFPSLVKCVDSMPSIDA